MGARLHGSDVTGTPLDVCEVFCRLSTAEADLEGMPGVGMEPLLWGLVAVTVEPGWVLGDGLTAGNLLYLIGVGLSFLSVRICVCVRMPMCMCVSKAGTWGLGLYETSTQAVIAGGWAWALALTLSLLPGMGSAACPRCGSLLASPAQSLLVRFS